MNLRVATKRDWTAEIDRAMTVVAVLHPLMALPQIGDIYLNRSAADVSLATWLLFSLMGVVFLAYGMAHRLKPIIVTQVLWFMVDAVIVTGILIYS